MLVMKAPPEAQSTEAHALCMAHMVDLINKLERISAHLGYVLKYTIMYRMAISVHNNTTGTMKD